MLVVPGAEPLTWTSLSVEAQVSRRTLYTHWDSVDELLTDIIAGSSVVTVAEVSDPMEDRLRSFLRGIRTRASSRVEFIVMVTTALSEKSKELPAADAPVYAILESWFTSFQNTVAPLTQEQYFMLAGPIVFQELFSVSHTSDQTIEDLVEAGLAMIAKLAVPVS